MCHNGTYCYGPLAVAGVVPWASVEVRPHFSLAVLLEGVLAAQREALGALEALEGQGAVLEVALGDREALVVVLEVLVGQETAQGGSYAFSRSILRLAKYDTGLGEWITGSGRPATSGVAGLCNHLEECGCFYEPGGQVHCSALAAAGWKQPESIHAVLPSSACPLSPCQCRFCHHLGPSFVPPMVSCVNRNQCNRCTGRLQEGGTTWTQGVRKQTETGVVQATTPVTAEVRAGLCEELVVGHHSATPEAASPHHGRLGALMEYRVTERGIQVDRWPLRLSAHRWLEHEAEQDVEHPIHRRQKEEGHNQNGT